MDRIPMQMWLPLSGWDGKHEAVGNKIMQRCGFNTGGEILEAQDADVKYMIEQLCQTLSQKPGARRTGIHTTTV